MIAPAGRSDLRVQLGCHPGETGLPSAAGRHLRNVNAAGIRYVEGSYASTCPGGEPHPARTQVFAKAASPRRSPGRGSAQTQ